MKSLNSFVETPDVVQEEGSPYVVVQWNSDYILLSKCVDFFYVEYQEVTNKSVVLFESTVSAYIPRRKISGPRTLSPSLRSSWRPTTTSWTSGKTL